MTELVAILFDVFNTLIQFVIPSFHLIFSHPLQPSTSAKENNIADYISTYILQSINFDCDVENSDEMLIRKIASKIYF